MALSACVITPEIYDNTTDDGTYTGRVIAFTGPGTNADFTDRVCPEVDISLVINDSDYQITLDDTYPNFGHVAQVVTNHSSSGQVFLNNKFEAFDNWPIEEADTQLRDLENLEICDSTPPSNISGIPDGDRGTLQDYAFKIDDTGFIGEYGRGQARGNIFYGIRCSDGRFLPTCVYFMELTKQ